MHVIKYVNKKSVEVVRMFQNIEKGYVKRESRKEDVKLYKIDEIKELVKKFFVKQNIILYIISFMISRN